MYRMNVSASCLPYSGETEKKKKKGGVGEGRNTPVMIQYDDSAAKLTFIGQTGKLIFGSTKL